MTKNSPIITIKPDPDTLKEEQDDLILSYLNTDYVSTDMDDELAPPCSPYSTSSASTDAGHSSLDTLDQQQQQQSLYIQDPFLFHLQTTFQEQGLPLPWPALPPFPGGNDLSCLMNIHPLYIPPQQQPMTPPRSSSCSSSDSEQSKKKRGGRKKRQVSIAPAPIKPLTRILPAANIPTPPPKEDVQQQDIVKVESSMECDNKSPAEIAYAKRQERLIKNRAAALLSRKRKREHLTTLEDERQQLVNENQQLHSKVSSLEAQVMSLEQENMELKRKLSSSSQHKHHHHHHHTSLATPKHAKTTGMVFMIILFSFALFTLPSSHSSDQLTVGGGTLEKSPIPLIGSRMPDIRLDTVPTSGTTTSNTDDTTSSNTTTDLMLIDHVRPDDLQSWIKAKLGQQQQDLVPWRGQQHLYLYADHFSQAAPLLEQDTTMIPALESTLSILCPLNTTSCEQPSYLQIDVQVLGSRVLEGEMKHRQQEDTVMFDSGKRRRHERRRFSRVVLE
ncbi:hypothetical protein BC941DRAFT_472903 [Chlamydoabsidia padenii]|nr:hypothetical protein BC941DRAFT_472903 [Chlamydoabsidia padenii]